MPGHDPGAAARGSQFERVLGRLEGSTDGPTVVVFGHTHRPYHETVGGVLYLNPGSAGAPRFGLDRTVCLVHLEAGGLRPEFIRLA